MPRRCEVGKLPSCPHQHDQHRFRDFDRAAVNGSFPVLTFGVHLLNRAATAIAVWRKCLRRVTDTGRADQSAVLQDREILVLSAMPYADALSADERVNLTLTGNALCADLVPWRA